MTSLCEVKSVCIYRNTRNIVLYFTVKKVGETNLLSAKITLEEIPACTLNQYLYFTFADHIGKQRISERVGKQLVATEIDRYQLSEITNYERTKTYKDKKCDFSMQE